MMARGQSGLMREPNLATAKWLWASLLDEIDPYSRELVTRARETMSTNTDAFEDDSTEMDSSHRVERLQGIVCCLLSRNEELRSVVQELKLLQLQIRTTREDE